jgi:hypothetical protein
MTKSGLGSVTLGEILRERQVGETVNPHVVAPVKAPEPDFDAMNRTIQANPIEQSNMRAENERENREVSKDD